ncbi:MAG: DUF3179 domain-containing protein [Flavobacteriales bacterium]|nr:DUF3179 domain-containing protein [Flavobacteriales bacterium]
MKNTTALLLVILSLSIISCKKRKEAKANEEIYWPKGTTEYCDRTSSLFLPDCRGEIVREGKVFIKDDRKFLFGGDNHDWDFDITEWCLNECQLHYGLGRERFKALIEPEYETVSAAENSYSDGARFIVLQGNHTVKAYPITLLTTHEVINDTIDGNPVMIVYCILADLAAVYDRVHCNRTLTFAVSGYTYFDKEIWDGLDGFILWDRDTESLWWPLIDKAVSGPMKGSAMVKYDKTKWHEATWSTIKSEYPNAEVLKDNQTMDPPATWTVYSSSGC